MVWILRRRSVAGCGERSACLVGVRDAFRADPEADNMEYHPRTPPDLLADAGGALKSALELRLRQREEGGPIPWRRAGV